MGATQSVSQPYTLSTPKGPITGIQQLSSKTNKPVLNRYTRIPYALPPVANLRWQRPQPIPTSISSSNFFSHTPNQSLDHTEFGPQCPQPEYNLDAVHLDNPNAAPKPDVIRDEDCLYLNIWTPPPSSTPPKGGWPVQFHIHGGWLQVGDANQGPDTDPFDLFLNPQLSPRIIVAPTYRLNIFGFAAGSALAETNGQHTDSDRKASGNFGLWDQRAALEWVFNNISDFDGNPSQITVGGLSAGSHSAFLQLYHDSHLPQDQRVISQVYLWSNALAVQPNAATGAKLNEQWSELCAALGVDVNQLDSQKQVEEMRRIPWQNLVDVIFTLKMHTFRTSTDGDIGKGGFVPPSFLKSLHDGSFATKLAQERPGLRIMIGEVKDEALLYKLINPPTSKAGLITQVGNYYPKSVVDALTTDLADMYGVPTSEEAEKNASDEDWANMFAKIVADGQVHASLRGVIKCLFDPSTQSSSPVKAMDKNNLFRYKIDWRAKGMDEWIKPEVGVCHAMDTPIWWGSGWRCGYDGTDQKKAEDWLKPFDKFFYGEKDIGWNSQNSDVSINHLRLLDVDGNVQENVRDEDWERGLKVYDTVWKAQRDVYN